MDELLSKECCSPVLEAVTEVSRETNAGLPLGACRMGGAVTAGFTGIPEESYLRVMKDLISTTQIIMTYIQTCIYLHSPNRSNVISPNTS